MTNVATSTNYYYLTDGLGSIVEIQDANKVTVEKYQYDSFGNPTIKDPAGTTISQSTINNPYLFTSREWDGETNLYYYRARYYDAGAGRFLSEDPLGFDGDDINFYIYALNNPVIYNDPLGLWAKLCSRRLGGPQKPPTWKHNPFRHDYLNVSGMLIGFGPADSMILGAGKVTYGGESGKGCHTMICNDNKFDKYVFDAASQYEPWYGITCGSDNTITNLFGVRNCQTWARTVINMAKKKYLKDEKCPKCFK